MSRLWALVGWVGKVLRFLFWRLLGALAGLATLLLLDWFAQGGPGKALRGTPGAGLSVTPAALLGAVAGGAEALWTWASAPIPAVAPLALGIAAAIGSALLCMRTRARRRRDYVRLQVQVYRGDHAGPEAVAAMFEALHKRVAQRWWRRLLHGQPSVALEVHHSIEPAAGLDRGGAATRSAWLAVSCVREHQAAVQAALRSTYPNCGLLSTPVPLDAPPSLLRLKKHAQFTMRVRTCSAFERDSEPPIDRLLTTMGAAGGPASVQLALTPAPATFERLAKHLFKRREARMSRERREHLFTRDRSLVDDAEMRGALELQHRSLFFLDLRVVAGNRADCEQIAAELRVQSAENRLVERGAAVRHGLLRLYTRRIQRGEGNVLPSFHKGIFASPELGAIWQLPSIDYLSVPLARSGVPLAPAPPGILRVPEGEGLLRDLRGPVSIHVDMRKQNVAVPGTVEQGKSSFLVASVAEDLRRERCAVIVLDPKGDAADAAVSLVPVERTCTVLDFSHPTCGFNPLAVDAPADVIADYVVAALKNLFSDADIRASSDRYLRNAIIAVLAHDRRSSLWDAARLLTVGEEGYAYRQRVGSKVRTLPEFKEISEFFTAELTTQLNDARSTTTAKLDAPVNKLARLLNSPSIKRVLLNDSLRVDFDRVIADGEVLVVKGALGAMGAGNTSTLMQLLVGMLDAALARQQDLVAADQRVAVALKVDEAPLVLNRGFAETMALKRSAGLETVACWQTDAQWIDRDVRDQLDALFAHRVYFATASTRDARAGASLMMSEFSDAVRPGIERLSALGRPDARLHLPRHHAIVSWSTPAGRQSPFVAQTLPLRVDRDRLALQAARQHERGARHMTDLRQPHWDREPDAPLPAHRIETPSAPDASPARRAEARSPLLPALPDSPAVSFSELVELDRAQSVRASKRPLVPSTFKPDRIDLEVLALLGALTYLLTSQVHRRFNGARAITTTQRRLKRLADAGLIERFQFHRRDGGGVPMCCAITEHGLQLLAEHEPFAQPAPDARDSSSPAGRIDAARQLRQARHRLHVSGWVLALAGCLGERCVEVRGAHESVLPAPTRAMGEGRIPLTVADLRLAGGRAPHDFLLTDATGASTAADRFQTLRPDATVEIAAIAGDSSSEDREPGRRAAIDLLVEFVGQASDGRAQARLERYDHFLSGWSAHTGRYGRRALATPLAVFVCRDRARAREHARAADGMLRAARAYAGEYPFDWEYPGREGIVFAAERDVHEGLCCAYGVPRLPPAVRVAAANGDPRAGEVTLVARTIAAVGPLAGESTS